MRTAIIIVVGFGLWAACLGVAKLLASSDAASMITAAVALVVSGLSLQRRTCGLVCGTRGIRFEKSYRLSC
jgi:hypothetical protein